MSDITDTLENVEEVTPEQILYQLLRGKKTSFHTEIENPIAVSCLDLLVNYFEEQPVISDLLKEYLKRFRVNMVAYKRKRAEEIVKAYSARQEVEEKKKVKDLLLGERE